MPDSRKPPRGEPRGEKSQPPAPPPRRGPPPPPKPPADDEIEPVTGPVELLQEPTSDAIVLEAASIPGLAEAQLAALAPSITPPPPPRPRRLTPPPVVALPPVTNVPVEDGALRPRRLTPPPPPRPARDAVDARAATAQIPAPAPQRVGPDAVPHRIGIDPTLPHAARASVPAPPAKPSLFHANVLPDSGSYAAERTDGVWDGELAVLHREVAALREREPQRASLLLGAHAQILVGYKGDRPSARAALQDALGLHEDRFALHLLRRDAMADKSFARALELARKELERLTDPKERLALLLSIGVLEEIVGKDRAAAKRAFEAARELDPRNATSLFALAELYLDDAQWSELAATYHALADTTSDPALRGMFRHAAGTVEERGLEDDAKARETYRTAVTEDASNLPAIVALSSLALRTEDWGPLARALEAEADLVGDATTQRRLYERAGDLYWERLSDAESAATAYRKAALAAPDAQSPLRRLAAVLESIGRWHELVDVLVAELPLCRSPESRAELHQLVGEVFENHLERPDEAVRAYEAALAEVPDHVSSLQALAGLFARSRRLDALIQAELAEAERITDPQRRAARYLHLGDLAIHVIGDETEAVRLYERCVELEPSHRAAFAALEAIHRRRGAFAPLALLHERQAETATSPAHKRMHLVSAARSLLDADRGDEQRALSPSFLARVAEHLQSAHAIDAPDLTPQHLLVDALEDAGQWEPLVDALGAIVSTDTREKIGLLHRAARVLELRLGADARALAMYETILGLDATHEAALLAVVRLHQRAGRSADEVAALGRLRDRASTPSEAAALSHRIGRIYERRTGDTEAAVRAYEEALARSPEFSPSLRALERVLRRDRRWPRLVEILERQLTAAKLATERAELRYAIGQIEELHRRELDRADDAYTQALKDVPNHEPARAALMQVREAKKDVPSLTKLFEEQRGRTQDPATLTTLLVRLGALAERANDAARSVQLHGQAVEASPIGARLRASLIRASRKHGGLVAATAQLRAFAKTTSDARLQLGARTLVALRDEATGADQPFASFDEPRGALVLDGVLRKAPTGALLVERAKVTEGAPLRALFYLEAACRLEKDGALREAASALEAADQAVNDLLPVLRGIRRIAIASEQWSAAVLLYAHEAELVVDPEGRAEALLQAGQVALERVGDARQALDHLRRLLATQPLHERAFDAAVQILEKAKDWLGIAALHRQRAEATTDPSARAASWRKKAEVERDRLRDVASALSSLRSALESAPDDLQSHKAIAPLQEHQRFWQDAIDTYHRIAELSAGDALARAAKVREADLRERELGDREGARLLLAELVADPNDRDAARRMAGLCERMGRWDEAQQMWMQLASTKSPQERASALLSLGSVLEKSSGDASASAGCYEEALSLALVDAAVIPLVETRFRDGKMLGKLVGAGERALRSAGEPSQAQLPLRVALARVYLEDLNEPAHAEAQLVVCTEIVPDDPAAFRRLGRLLVATGRSESALPLLHRALELDASSADTLRALGDGLGHTGLKDAPRLFESAASFVEGSAAPAPVAPLAVRRGLSADEWAMYFPRESGPGKVALSELARTVEPHAAALVLELTGERPVGAALPPGPADAIVRATFQALGVAPLRVYVDPHLVDEVVLCADDTLALNVGAALLQPDKAGRLAFELARLGAWIAQGETLGAFLRGPSLSGFIQAACDDGGDDTIKEVRRRVGKALPRKLRKELERFSLPLADATNVATAWERSGAAAAAELALLICRDAGVVLDFYGYRRGEALPVRGRGVDLVRFMASEDCWRAYRRLTDG